MTAAATSDRLPLADVMARLAAPGGYEAFRRQVVGARACRQPVRLRGGARTADGRVAFDSRQLPDGVLLKACGTRREALCPPCASLYRSDAFHLVVSGLRGGKGVGEDVAGRPAVFLTLTAPSFGAVHRRLADGSCHLSGRRCPHGRALVCARPHADDDPALGEALCPSCYDYEAAVLFNASVSELWRRTTIYGLRCLGALVGLSVRQAAARWRLSYAKVVEFQRRGSVHLHAVVRLDPRTDGGELTDEVDGATLARALALAATKVSAPCPGNPTRRLHWGAQFDTAVVGEADDARRRAAAYCAKYATKSVMAGGSLDRRLRAGIPPRLELPDHLRHLVETAFALAGREDLRDLRLRLWAHSLGFRGHVLTKSRRYSTTFSALRAARQHWVLSQRGGVEPPAESSWSFVGVGYVTAGDVWLAAGFEEELRLGRQIAYEQRLEQQAVL